MYKVKTKWFDFNTGERGEDAEVSCPTLEGAYGHTTHHMREIEDGRQWFVQPALHTYAVVYLREVFRDDGSPVLYGDADHEAFESNLKAKSKPLPW